MKTTFTTVDLLAVVTELKQRVVGLRVAQIYDVDAKTYLIKLQKPDHKCVLLLESGSRIHTTEYEWPKSPAPSGFSMKLRKHLRNKRLEEVRQLGVDRVLDLKFGSQEAEHHILVELYDRGNIVLTDASYTILNVLRPRRDGEEVRLAVHEQYPVERARQARPNPTVEELRGALSAVKENTTVKKALIPLLDCGSGVVEHQLLEAGLPPTTKVTQCLRAEEDLARLHTAACRAQEVVTGWAKRPASQGYIIKKMEKRSKVDGTMEDIPIYQEFIPMLYKQYSQTPVESFPTFNQACDDFFSKMESVKIDQKAVQKEKEVHRKLANVKRDHERRLQELVEHQRENEERGRLIELNKDLVDKAINVVRSTVANQVDWTQIAELLSEAQARGDPVALVIRQLKLQTNSMTLLLSDPYDCEEDDLFLDSDEEREEGNESTKMRPMMIEIDLDLSAMANARRYFDMKRQAAQKEQKTISASHKVVQLTQRKTQQTLKEVAAITNINKARKVFWFEKFLWFISSENYLVLAGRDSQQNELVVKRHLRPGDVYVHADMHGAASVVIKNPSGREPPPKTLHEAGIMALCYSRAWDEKVVTSAWWVWGSQVSKTAPSGEYLTMGSFMVRGRKNFLPPSHLVYGFSFLFRLEDDSIPRHAGERKVRGNEGEAVEEDNTKEPDDQSEIPLLEEEEDEGEASKEAKIEEEENKTIKEEVNKEENEEEEEAEDKDEGTGDVKSEEEEEKQHDEPVEFPDTMVEMSHIGGAQFSLRTRTVSTVSHTSGHSGGHQEDGEGEGDEVIFLGDNKPVVVHRRKNDSISSAGKGKGEKKGGQRGPPGHVDQLKEEVEGVEGKSVPPKRGQRGKIKKREKYRDQDDEERNLRMSLLQSAGNNKENNKKGKAGKKGVKEGKGKAPPPSRPGPKNAPKDAAKPPPDTANTEPTPAKKEERVAEAAVEEEEEEATQVADDLAILDALTALP
ncbi:Nuclear export mediator factor Nemf [Chionoecetes opilio]|uniref:Nuclear export mediator factor Nemf n=1 Tax=Chionoecetes opilio TaxID=41210 RepID=A0A8J4XX02_CHIOP|nr:Nuclear export mediator factor Nemf [Chionoecetes opilio]